MLPLNPDVIFIPNFLSKEKADAYFARLLTEIEYKPETYTFKDNIVTTKRKISFFSEKEYTYSSQTYPERALNDFLNEIKTLVEKETGYSFNAVLCNHYEDGEAGMGWHADKEKELGDKPVIASLSFGETRRFAFRHRKELVGVKNPPRLAEYELNSGDLLIMKGDCQKYFEHCLIKDKSKKGTRINLTFRKVVT